MVLVAFERLVRRCYAGKSDSRNVNRGPVVKAYGGSRINLQTICHKGTIGFGDQKSHTWVCGENRRESFRVEVIGVVMGGRDDINK